MDALKMILILTSILTRVADAFPTVMRKNKPNFVGIPSLPIDVYEENICMTDGDCNKTKGYFCNQAKWQCQLPCDNRRSCPPALTCNLKQGFCGAPTTFDSIMKKQGCPRIIKKTCITNNDCACAEAEYVCEEELSSTKKECVPKKPKHEQNKREEGQSCNQYAQCESPFDCMEGICQMDFASFGDAGDFLANLFGKNEKQKS